MNVRYVGNNMTESITEKDIIKILSKKYNEFQYYLVPNSKLFGWEMDLAILTKAGYLHEFEIKTDFNDFVNDAKKDKWNRPYYQNVFNKYIKKFYYVIPQELYSEFNAGIIHPFIQKTFGLITIDDRTNYVTAKIRLNATINKNAEKLKQMHVDKLNKTIYFKMWSMYKK